jgi:hypothetical protein
MSIELDPQLRRVLADRVRYYNDLGILHTPRNHLEGGGRKDRVATTVHRQHESTPLSASGKLAAVDVISPLHSKSPNWRIPVDVPIHPRTLGYGMGYEKVADSLEPAWKMEPTIGLEPMTCRLRKDPTLRMLL